MMKQRKIYQCDRCKLTTNKLSNYTRHINRKNPCKENEFVNVERKEHICLKCGYKFTRNHDLKRHLKICKDIIFNNNIEKIILCPFGKEGSDCITTEELLKIPQMRGHYIVNIIKLVNLNPNKPQYHNILCTDMTRGLCKIYENGKWYKDEINEILDSFVDKTYANIKKFIDEQKNIGIFHDEIEKNLTGEFKDMRFHKGKRGKNYYMKSVKAMLYNNRDIVQNTKYLIKKQEEKEFIKNHVDDINDNKNDYWLDKEINKIIEKIYQTNANELNDVLNKMNNLLNKNDRKKIKNVIFNIDYENEDDINDSWDNLELFIHNAITKNIKNLFGKNN